MTSKRLNIKWNRSSKANRKHRFRTRENGTAIMHTYFDSDTDISRTSSITVATYPIDDTSAFNCVAAFSEETKTMENQAVRRRRRQHHLTKVCKEICEGEIVNNGQKSSQTHMGLNQAMKKSRSKTGGFAMSTDSKTLVRDVKRGVINRLFTSPSLLKLAVMDGNWRELCAVQTIRFLRHRFVIDVAQFFRGSNPFLRTFVNDNGKSCAHPYHNDIKRLVTMLKKLAEYITHSCGGTANRLELENLTPKALGWIYSYSEDQLLRCPIILQEKIHNLLLHDFKATTKYTYWRSFMKPEMFLGILLDRVDQITSLNLGDLKSNQPLLRCSFPNLKELIWHNAHLDDDLTGVNLPKLSSLSLTAMASSMNGFEIITRSPSLEQLFTGLIVPDEPTRFDMDVLLRSYQRFWNTSVSVEDGDEEDAASEGRRFVITTLSKLNYVAFWNAPEKLFVIMGKRGIRFETLQFGQLNQSLTRLCSFDSIMQTLFKFNQPKYECYKLDVSHLKMYLHAMPVVSLDYYLPQLMMGVNNALCSIRSFDLFIHCTFSATMPSSWVLEGRHKNSQSKLRCLTHFSFHIDGFCLFDDLDCHLPPTLSCISISISLPVIGASKSVASLLVFIERLADVNAYPDLEELHLQVWGVRCAESLLNHVADHVSDIRHLSVIAMPVEEERSRIIDLIRHVSASCHRLVSLKLSVEMMRLLLDDYGDLRRHNWRLAIARLGEECHLRDSCELGINHLPHTSGWDDYYVIPHYPKVSEVDISDFGMGCASGDEETAESEISESEGTESCSNDSFIVDDEDVEADEDEDELDYLDQQLEDETERSHERYLRKRNRRLSSSTEENEQCDNEDEEEDNVTEFGDSDDESDEETQDAENPFIDGEAVEAMSGTESEDANGIEEEDEGVIFTSDEEMIEVNAQIVNARPRKNHLLVNRKKQLLVSDSD